MEGKKDVIFWAAKCLGYESVKDLLIKKKFLVVEMYLQYNCMIQATANITCACEACLFTYYPYDHLPTGSVMVYHNLPTSMF